MTALANLMQGPTPLGMTLDEALRAAAASRMQASPIGPFPGMFEPPNIDLAARPVVHLPDGSIATVDSASNRFGRREVLFPTVSPEGRMLTVPEGSDLYRRSGQHLGIFDNPADADRYAEALHEAQARFYAGR
jgi:hypothetical protein